MSRRDRTWLRSWPWSVCCLALACLLARAGGASEIVLKDGRRLQGRIGKTSGLADNPLSPKGEPVMTITFIDDDLRRVFFPAIRVGQLLEAGTGEVPENIRIRQNVAKDAGSKVNRVGQIARIGPFDERGHRTLSMMTDKGLITIVQGITRITPTFVQVEALRTAGKPALIWDMRIATSSVPRTTLSAILKHYVDPKNLDQRLKVVRLYLQGERYQDAQTELQAVIADFPPGKDQDDSRQAQLAAEVKALKQLHARSIVKEIEVRRKAGQHALAFNLLDQFPVEGVAGETLQQVKEMLDDYQDSQHKVEQVNKELAEWAEAIKDTSARQQCDGILEEIKAELSRNTLDRMVDYLRLSTDASLGPDQKVSLAISGWLLGANHAETNLGVTLSLVKIRGMVVTYMNEPVKLNRTSLFDRIRSQEGAAPALIAGLIANMKPPKATPEAPAETPGSFELEVPLGIEQEPDATSYVQLPPEYDPHVHYPTIVVLNGSGTTAQHEIDWWAGERNAQGVRQGQASRLGYIVVAVDWLKPGQKEYEYSAREHAAVLVSLRDACRRFSIDTDRVYLAGHSLGGNAAWDIGLAHPDLWAGVIPIVAQADKYCSHYSGNAKLVPFYVLAGELDGDLTLKNSKDLDKYMNARYDVTVTEYLGRGHEDFYEDVQNIFDWMARKQRNFFPKDFTVDTMRTWDNYFWWIEVRDFPERAVVEPIAWPPGRGVRPLKITGKVQANNGLLIMSGDVKVTVWLSPDLVDFNRPVPITFNRDTLNKGSRRIEPNLEVLLEDARTRADRQHPFWAKVSQ